MTTYCGLVSSASRIPAFSSMLAIILIACMLVLRADAMPKGGLFAPSNPNSQATTKEDSTTPIIIKSNNASTPASYTPSADDSTTEDPCKVLLLKATNGYLIMSPSFVVTCYDSFKLNPEIRKAQVAALKTYYHLYPFLDMAMQSVGQTQWAWTSNVDIMDSLEAIANNTNITTEYELQYRITSLVHSLFDAHASYKSSCFSRFMIAQPFVLQSKNIKAGQPPEIFVRGSFTQESALFINGNATESKLASNLEQWWSNTSGVDVQPSKYAGYVVVSIDGQDPIAAIQEYADKYSGISRANETRFNYVLQSYLWGTDASGTPGLIREDGSFYLRRQFPPGLKDFMTYELLGPTGDKVTYIGAWAALPINKNVTASLKSSSTYYEKWCQGASAKNTTTSNSGIVRLPNSVAGVRIQRKSVYVPSKTSSFRQAVHGFISRPGDLAALTNPISENELAKKAANHLRSLINFKKNSVDSDDGEQHVINEVGPVVSDENGAFFNLDGKTGVWVLSTFSPNNDTDEGISAWVTTITEGLAALEKQGVTRLLIDVSNNGGGIICIGQALIQYLFPEQRISFMTYDMRMTKTLMDLFEDTPAAVLTNVTADTSLVFTVHDLATPSKVKMTSPEDLFHPGREFFRGGKNGLYTNPFTDGGCDETIKFVIDPTNMVQLKKGWGFKNIAFVSNGVCGSTCATVVRVMRDQFKVRTYTYGGPTGQLFQPTSFEGGCVAHFSALYRGAQQVAATIDDAPSAFPLPVDGSIPFWEGYSTEVTSTTPAEFIKQPAEEHLIDVVDPTDAYSVWKSAAAKLDKVADAGPGSRTTA